MRRRTIPDVPPILATCVLLIALTVFWYVEAVGANDEMSALEAWLIPLYMAAVVAGQCVALAVVAYLGRRLLGARWPVALFAGALCALNFYGAYLAHFWPFLAQDDWVQWTVLLVALVFAFILTWEMQQSRAVRIAAVVIGPLLALGLLVGGALAGGEGGPVARDRSAQAGLSPGMATDAAKVRKVEFARRPNVYLFVFDALTSDEVVFRHIGMPPPLDYTRVLEANGARVVPNAFSDGASTKHTLNSLFALDLNYFDKLTDSQKHGFFAGRRRSPLAEIYRHNGYRIQTISRDNYLGRWQGPYVDFYGVPNVVGTCHRIDARLAFLGYCAGRIRAVLRRLVPAVDRSASGPPYLEFVLERLRVPVRDGHPWLTLAYLPLPGHVEIAYDHRRASDRDAFRETFARNQSTAAREMEAVIATIRQVDPGAVALVFGDHGLLLSLNLGSESYLEDPEFYVLDHLAIRMAIWPADACRRELDDVAGLGFITVAMAMRAIITCLSDGVDPVDKSVTYSVPFWTRDRYERYLYERAPKGRAASP